MTVRKLHSAAIALMAISLMSGGLAVLAQSNSGQDNSTTLPDAQIESNVLRALASAPELASQNIQTSTVYGTVTLTGNVHDEAMRTTAENLAARAQGVKKVVDELVLGDTPPPAAGDQAGAGRSEWRSGQWPAGRITKHGFTVRWNLCASSGAGWRTSAAGPGNAVRRTTPTT